ncbi:hypothetical protein Hamer_G029875 [Homarus americanus]|uniref:Uncharacterized protein n=1 Tax=Homarus americanus TaxID=6706 RepID=A0A8J5JUW5_HOMAM|nr:hypothetical protein Hamer_G029875 [Homarus americanus]
MGGSMGGRGSGCGAYNRATG